MRVAIVHDYLTHFGGAERVLQVLMQLFPHAPVFTLLYDDEQMAGHIDPRRIRTSALQRVPFARSQHRLFPLVMPIAVEQFNLSRYDLVISASHSFGKGVLTGADTLHVSYCFTPLRYAWDDSHRYIREFGVPGLVRAAIPFALNYVRVWDALAADRVDEFVAISQFVRQRIRKYYQRDAAVIYPPVDCSATSRGTRSSGRYLIVSRLLPYKRIDVAMEAFNLLKLPLDIVGTGPEEERLRSLAGPSVRFHGFVPDETVRALMSSCEAFLFPQEEDFGIAPLEAGAAGKPVIAFAGGGALETIVDGTTGVFFHDATPQALAAAVEQQKRTVFNPAAIRAHALQFDTSQFTVRFMDHITSSWRAFERARTSRISVP